MTERPISNPGLTKKRKTGCGGIYLIDNTASDYPEIFLMLGKSGGCASSMCQFIARIISFTLRTGIKAGISKEEMKERIIKAGKGVRCHSPTISGGVEVLSCADAIAQILEEE